MKLKQGLLLLWIITVGTIFSSSAQNTSYPWLDGMIDTEDCCFNRNVDVYDYHGVHKFIFIANDENCSSFSEGFTGSLYYQDGTLWCNNRPDLDCRTYYKISYESTIYECGGQQESGNNVVVYNSFEDATLTGGQQGFFGAGGPEVITEDAVEFPGFIGFYDIDVNDCGLTMTLIDNSGASDLLLPDGRFDRYYFGFDSSDFSNLSVSGGSPGLTVNASVTSLPAGYTVPVEDLFGTGYPLPITLPNGGFMLQLGGGTDLTELGQTISVDFGCSVKIPEKLTIDDEGFFPEDIVIANGVVYVGGLGDGTLRSFDLTQALPEAQLFAAAEEGYTQRWGLKSDGTVLLSILDNANFGGGAPGPSKLVEYNIASGEKTGEWDLPANTIGHTVSIVDGKYYVTDFGNPRIMEFDPTANTVNENWFTSSEWDPEISGIGGTIYDNDGGFYIAQGNKLWYLPISDSRPGTLQQVTVSGLDAIDADGISWVDGQNTLYYATNDTGDPANAGTVSKLVFSDKTTATGSVVATGLDDSSGLWYLENKGNEYVFVLESQFGALFGINSFEPPFNIAIIDLNANKELTNEQKARAFIEGLGSGDPVAYSYISDETYIQHNLNTPAPKEALAGLFTGEPTGIDIDIHRSYEIGDYVVLHTTYGGAWSQIGGTGSDQVAIDVYRFEDGLIVEHWDNLADIVDDMDGTTQTDGAVTPATDLESTDANQALLEEMAQTLFVDGDWTNLRTYFDLDKYIQHSVGSGPDGAFLATLDGLTGVPFYDDIKFIHTLGNFGLVMSQGPDIYGVDSVGTYAYYDLFRMEDGKIVEHWDVIQLIPPQEEWANDNGKWGDDAIPPALTNEEKARAIANGLATGDEVAYTYFGDQYIQHNLNVPTGKEAIAGFFAGQPSGITVDIHRSYEIGDIVVLHATYGGAWGDLTGSNSDQVAFDVFRFEDGLAVEHWDNLTNVVDDMDGTTQTDGAVTPATDLESTDANEALLEEMAQILFVDGDWTNLRTYFDLDKYIQHSVGSGPDGAFLATLDGLTGAPFYDDIKYVHTLGNFGLVMSQGPDIYGVDSVGTYAYYDLFRMEDGKIVEHWDVIDAIPPRDQWANDNGKWGDDAIINPGADGDNVVVYNSFEDATLTGGQQGFFGASDPAVVADDTVEFPGFIGFYDIDVNDCGLTMTLIDNSGASDLLLPDGRFDRYYFGFDSANMPDVSVSGGSAGLTVNASVTPLPAGYTVPVEDLFGTGYALPITLPNGGFLLQLGGGTDLTELGQTISVDFGCPATGLSNITTDTENFFPEDITIANDVAYVGSFANGTLYSFDLTQDDPEAQVFAAGEEGYPQAWGLKSDGTILLSLLNNADFTGNPPGPAKLVQYDIASGSKTAEWDLPANVVGHTVSIVDGKYYVTNFGFPQIFEVDPTAGTVTEWFTSDDWDASISGIGGTIYDNDGGFYVSQGNKLWYLPINGDEPGTLEEVTVTGLDGVDADGISWVDSQNTLYYATNDTGDPANAGTAYKLVFSDKTTATGSVVATGLDDSSGLWYYESDGNEYVYVLESQFGALFGINEFDPPFNIEIVDLSTVEAALPPGVGRIADNIYSYGANDYYSMFVVTTDGVIAIDPVSTEHAEGFLEAIQGVTDQSVKYLLYSHDHWDSSSGGKVFEDAGVTSMAHIDAYRAMEGTKGPDVTLPDESWEGCQRNITLGETTIEMHYLGLNHGQGMTVFLEPEQKVAYIADLVSANSVFYSIVPDYNVPEWKRTLEEIIDMDFEKAVYLHNYNEEPLLGGDKEDVVVHLQLIRDIRNAVFQAFQDGTNVNDIRLPQYQDLFGYDDWFYMNVNRIMLDLFMGPYPISPVESCGGGKRELASTKSKINLGSYDMCSLSCSHGHNSAKKSPPETVEIAENVYSFALDNFYSMFVVTTDGVIVIEPKETGHSEAMLAAIKEVTDQPVKYLLYSHDHYDHSSGGQVFKDAGATSMAHIEAYETMHANPGPDMLPPDESWEGCKSELTLGETTLELHYFGVNHGLGMTVFVVPEQRIAYIADLAVPNRLLFSVVPDFNMKEWERTLERIVALDFDKGIYSHNESPDAAANAGDMQDAVTNLQIIKDMRQAIAEELAKGTPARQIPTTVKLPQYENLVGYDAWLPMNLWRVYLETEMGPYPYREVDSCVE